MCNASHHRRGELTSDEDSSLLVLHGSPHGKPGGFLRGSETTVSKVGTNRLGFAAGMRSEPIEWKLIIMLDSTDTEWTEIDPAVGLQQSVGGAEAEV